MALSPDTLIRPPGNQLILPRLSSQSWTRSNGFIQRSLSAAAAPQNRSGSVTESRYKSRWGSRDSSDFHVPGGGSEENHRSDPVRRVRRVRRIRVLLLTPVAAIPSVKNRNRSSRDSPGLVDSAPQSPLLLYRSRSTFFSLSLSLTRARFFLLHFLFVNSG